MTRLYRLGADHRGEGGAAGGRVPWTVLRTLDLNFERGKKNYLFELSGSFKADLNTVGPKQGVIRKRGSRQREAGSRAAGSEGRGRV